MDQDIPPARPAKLGRGAHTHAHLVMLVLDGTVCGLEDRGVAKGLRGWTLFVHDTMANIGEFAVSIV